MTRLKIKALSATQNVQPRCFVAIHQDRLMQAFTRGFVPVQDSPLLAEASISDASIERAKGDETWGSVFLLEVSGDAPACGTFRVNQPLLLTDVVACWAPSRDAALEIEARMETFDDTVPAALEIKVDSSVFTSGGEPLAEQARLAFGPSDTVMPDAGEASTIEMPSIDPVVLEKLAGAISSIGSYERRSAAPIAETCELLSLPDDANAFRATEAIHRLALHAYRVVRPRQNESGDERIYVAAATMLHEISTKDGIEPIHFVERLLANDSQLSLPGAEAELFLETLKKVLDNRIELSDSKIDDTGMIGQRALMIFLLAPRAEQLERWISARPVGKGVAILASILSGLYCGLGGISRDSKAVTRGSFLGAIAAARLAIEGNRLQADSFRSWDENGNLIERISLAGFDFFERASPASSVFAELLQELRIKGVFDGVEPSSGAVRALLGDEDVVAIAQIGEARFHLPVGPIIRLTLRTRTKKRGQIPRELLVGLLGSSLWPVVPSLDSSTGDILLEVEVVPGNDISKGLAAIHSALKSLDLAAVEELQSKPKKATRKAQATAKNANSC